jgi:hypothetical protein
MKVKKVLSTLSLSVKPTLADLEPHARFVPVTVDVDSLRPQNHGTTSEWLKSGVMIGQIRTSTLMVKKCLMLYFWVPCARLLRRLSLD